MNIQLQDAPLPEDAISPARWAIFALWQLTPEERDVEFTQRTEIISPSGVKFAEATSKFKITEIDDLQSKNQIDLFGLPISVEGFLKIRVWLENIADASGEYQFLIKHVPKEKDAERPITENTTT
jgi:hypothetical protein